WAMVEIVRERGMSWKTFFQTILLMCALGFMFYIVYPKYQHGFKLPYRANKITGKVEYWMNGKWYVLKDKDKQSLFARIGNNNLYRIPEKKLALIKQALNRQADK
ncbi:MAG: hypothetical protein PHE97_06250, partial [Candidatus Omnitrophica bacterium]|nr:hypothetical protein [Candidatus Omnitrophota bacterium]